MRRHDRLVLALACALAVPALLGAAEPEALPPPDLPAAPVAERALRDSPLLQIARESVARGEARRDRLRAGPHEWEIEATTQRRKDPLGGTFDEQEYGLATGVRWPWKYTLDRRLGDLERTTGELAYSDAWHEAGRTLLDLWFAWLRESHNARLAEAQATVVRAQRDAVARRVDAGDAAPMELQLAEAETRQFDARRATAVRDADLAREALVREFPGVPLELPARLREPAALPGTDEDWVTRIVDHNHEIELAEAGRDAAVLAAERAARERLADPVVGLRYSDNLDGNRRVVGLTFRMPLGGGARAADAALARSEARAAQAQAQRTADHVAATARGTVADARRSFEAWQARQAALAQQQAAADTIAKGYAQGEFDVAVLLTSRRDALAAEQELLDGTVRAQWAQARVLLDAHLLWPPADHERELH